eukprot:m.63473 g.63473  ORF g.63473 m.63473 type:complete len:207 (-) comp8070_c1_seq1:434-1054(-)
MMFDPWNQKRSEGRRGSMPRQSRRARRNTFGELVVIASKKNASMDSDVEPIHRILLQKRMWGSLQKAFDECDDKNQLVKFPAWKHFDPASPTPSSTLSTTPSTTVNSPSTPSTTVNNTASNMASNSNERPCNNSGVNNKTQESSSAGRKKITTRSNSASKTRIIFNPSSSRQQQSMDETKGVRYEYGETILIYPSNQLSPLRAIQE